METRGDRETQDFTEAENVEQPETETVEQPEHPSESWPRYRCHKLVWALKIASIEPLGTEAFTICFAGGEYQPMLVDSEWALKHHPRAGGYVVLYEDGYRSYSPAAAFESGYTLIDPDAVPVEPVRQNGDLVERLVGYGVDVDPWWDNAELRRRLRLARGK